MPFSHNDHYHPLLLRRLPAGARSALDVGCGTGTLARRLAARGIDVDGVDPAAEVIDMARALGSPGPGRISYHRADVREHALPAGYYDYISCLASLHHMPFGTVTMLRDALAPGGVLVVLGPAKPRAVTDWGTWIAAAPANLVARGIVAAAERLNGGPEPRVRAPVSDWDESMTDVRRNAARLLPGSTVRTLLFWRYLLTYREPAVTS
ncbi:class I SAM-dependent methyltransferase [Amycolatopsis cihanbeyliensis]|uniref:Methyltransferase family protein n=1 Tax=Amycolatopsis cihanbeyliensis TaxID=1128664 RepID=A0A542CTS5_AMYCI|nr:class I SAM-dependent methyltransferase [Amycolatopsis cihanbeyliensis]TQI94219.1 methyltransferase family protein [Amycolatopsis cihanbeyliensis]